MNININNQGGKEKSSQRSWQSVWSRFLLIWCHSSIVSKQGGKSSVQYQIEMKLVNISTGELVWSGIEKLEKTLKEAA